MKVNWTVGFAVALFLISLTAGPDSARSADVRPLYDVEGNYYFAYREDIDNVTYLGQLDVCVYPGYTPPSFFAEKGIRFGYRFRLDSLEESLGHAQAGICHAAIVPTDAPEDMIARFAESMYSMKAHDTVAQSQVEQIAAELVESCEYYSHVDVAYDCACLAQTYRDNVAAGVAVVHDANQLHNEAHDGDANPECFDREGLRGFGEAQCLNRASIFDVPDDKAPAFCRCIGRRFSESDLRGVPMMRSSGGDHTALVSDLMFAATDDGGYSCQ